MKVYLMKLQGCGTRPAWLKAIARATRLVALAVVLAAGPTGLARADQSTDDSAVFATIGDHQITRKDVDDAIMRGVSPAQLYDMRKQSLDKLVDDYLSSRQPKRRACPANNFWPGTPGRAK